MRLVSNDPIGYDSDVIYLAARALNVIVALRIRSKWHVCVSVQWRLMGCQSQSFRDSFRYAPADHPAQAVHAAMLG